MGWKRGQAMLTKRQHDLLLFIHRMVIALEQRGFIRRLPHRARAIEILRMPNGEVSTEALLRENARLVMALLRARDALEIYEHHPQTALSEVRAALPRWARDDHVARMVGDG